MGARQGHASVGIRELKAKVSSIIEDIRTRRVTYAVTRRGVVEALLVPPTVDQAAWATSSMERQWEEFDRALEQLAAGGDPEAASALDELDGMRR